MSAREARENKISNNMLHKRKLAAMMHAGGGVPFMMMTKFASLDANTKKHE
jgi:hypothetical protein